jgi:hypothetical protein
MKITIIIEEGGNVVSVQPGGAVVSGSPADRPQNTPPPPPASVEPPGAAVKPPPADAMALGIKAGRLLEELHVAKPGKLLVQYQAERLIAVCEAALRQKDTLKNPAGYVLCALRRGWAV